MVRKSKNKMFLNILCIFYLNGLFDLLIIVYRAGGQKKIDIKNAQ